MSRLTCVTANIDLLSSIFKRPVVGIHNRTYGVVFDLMECLVQRCFSYSTEDTRIIYQHLKSVLQDQRITRVVCIAHSQGGIILSTALDSLFADVPSGAFDKLEIYTFGFVSLGREFIQAWPKLIFCQPLKLTDAQPTTSTTPSVSFPPSTSTPPHLRVLLTPHPHPRNTITPAAKSGLFVTSSTTLMNMTLSAASVFYISHATSCQTVSLARFSRIRVTAGIL